MDEIRATLDAAYIQGLLGFAGALIGALALIISIKIAAKNTVDEIKLEKVAESKRDQYIALTDSYTRFLTSSIILRPDNKNDSREDWYQHLDKYIELLGCINKVNLITTSEIRLELYELEKELISYQTSVSNFYFNSHHLASSRDLESAVFEFAKLLRSDLGIESNPTVEMKITQLRSK
ncbi:hypothetical protein M5F03_02480 [Acinetobacter sp. ANC 5579]|uniref:hypothetical protein n=1 Tax=Acinetobacter amyesii TaxID=2942470 RepID=UPI0020BF8EDE|nr:hypothetical protein [Acinetobacter amyesii]MCL6234044.1 hypothetical protein [Acinetobacter amyesii]